MSPLRTSPRHAEAPRSLSPRLRPDPISHAERVRAEETARAMSPLRMSQEMARRRAEDSLRSPRSPRGARTITFSERLHAEESAREMSPLRTSQGVAQLSTLPPARSSLRPCQPISHLERMHAEEAARSMSPHRVSQGASPTRVRGEEAVPGGTSPRPCQPISHAERLRAEDTARAMSPFRVSERVSPLSSPRVSPRSRSIGSICQTPHETLLKAPPSPKNRVTLGSSQLPLSKSLLVQEESISLKLLQKERDQTNAEDARFFGEVAEHIDLLQLDVARHKKRHIDTEERERAVTRGFMDREMRYANELRELETLHAKGGSETEEIRQHCKYLDVETERVKQEKAQSIQNRLKIEEIARATTDRLREDIRDALAVKADLETQIYKVKRRQQEQQEENERLRNYLAKCQDDLGRALR